MFLGLEKLFVRRDAKPVESSAEMRERLIRETEQFINRRLGHPSWQPDERNPHRHRTDARGQTRGNPRPPSLSS